MVKVSDKVLVIAGDDKGKEGTVTKVLRNKHQVIVSGINIVTKHQKPNAMSESGGRVQIEAPIDISNVKVVKEDTKAKEVKTTDKKKVEKDTKEAKTTKKTTKKSNKKESGDK